MVHTADSSSLTYLWNILKTRGLDDLFVQFSMQDDAVTFG